MLNLVLTQKNEQMFSKEAMMTVALTAAAVALVLVIRDNTKSGSFKLKA